MGQQLKDTHIKAGAHTHTHPYTHIHIHSKVPAVAAAACKVFRIIERRHTRRALVACLDSLAGKLDPLAYLSPICPFQSCNSAQDMRESELKLQLCSCAAEAVDEAERLLKLPPNVACSGSHSMKVPAYSECR